MKIDTYSYPNSSFLSVEKDLDVLINLIMKNDRLKKLLWYDTPDCLDKPSLTKEQSNLLIKNNKIRIIPKYYIDGNLYNGLVIKFTDFRPNGTNPEFRNNSIEFDIITSYDQWMLKDFEMRPYRIAAEIDSMLEKQRLTGIGQLDFMGATPIEIDDNYGGFCLMYNIIHGDEDKKDSLNPMTQEDIVKNFNQMFNNIK